MRLANLLFGGVVGLAAAVVVVSGASAQSIGSAPAVPAGRETEFNLDSYVYYDSNAARSDARLAAARGLALSEAIFEPSGSFTVARQTGRLLVFVTGEGGYDLHSYNKIRDHEHLDFNGGASGHFVRCQETLTGGYNSAQTDLGDVSFGVVTNNRENESVGLMVNCGRSVGLAPSLSVGESWTNNSAIIERVVDARTFHINGGLGYQRPGLGVATLFGAFSEITYPNRLTPVPSGDAGVKYDVYEGGARFERHVGGRIDTSLSVSYSVLDPSPGVGAGFHGLTFALDGTYHLTTRLAFHANGSRATQPSTRVNSNFELIEIYEGDVDYRLGSRLDFKVTGSWRRENFVGSGARLPGFLDLTLATTYDASAALTYNLNHRISFILNVDESHRTANLAGLSYDDTIVGLTAKAAF